MILFLQMAYADCDQELVQSGNTKLTFESISENTKLCSNTDISWTFNNVQICDNQNTCTVPSSLLEGAKYTIDEGASVVDIATSHKMPVEVESLGCTDQHFENTCLKVGSKLPPFGSNTLTHNAEYFSWNGAINGKQATSYIVSYFGSYCLPCRIGAPIMDDAAMSRPQTQALFFAYNEKKDADVLQFQKSLNIQSKIFVVRGNLAERHGIVNNTGDGQFPMTLLINHKGEIFDIFGEEGDPEVFTYILNQQLDMIDKSAPQDVVDQVLSNQSSSSDSANDTEEKTESSNSQTEEASQQSDESTKSKKSKKKRR